MMATYTVPVYVYLNAVKLSITLDAESSDEAKKRAEEEIVNGASMLSQVSSSIASLQVGEPKTHD